MRDIKFKAYVPRDKKIYPVRAGSEEIGWSGYERAERKGGGGMKAKE